MDATGQPVSLAREAGVSRSWLYAQDNHQLRDALACALGQSRTGDMLRQPANRDTPERRTPEISWTT
jgi:hypothetical protein